MKKTLILIIILYAVLLKGAWLPSNAKVRILSPLSESLKEINNLEISVQSFFSRVDTLAASVEPLSPALAKIQNIKQTNLKSNITMLLHTILESESLHEKNQYLSGLSEYKPEMESSLFSHLSNVVEESYLFRTTHNELNNDLPEYKNSAGSMNARILQSMRVSENELTRARSNRESDPEPMKKIEIQHSTLKSKLSGRTNIIPELISSLEIKSSVLDDVYNDLIAGLTGGAVVVSQGAEGIGKENASGGRPQDVQDKASQIMELSRSLLSTDMRKGIEHLENNDLEKATAIFQKEIADNPDNWMAMKYMAQVYTKENRIDLAIQQINKALKIFKKEMGIK